MNTTYDLPKDLIAQRPCEPRDSARLLVLNRSSGEIAHRVFRDLPTFLQPGDCLVLNDTKVVPARLYGQRADTERKVELLLLAPEGESIYRCLGQPGKRLRPGAKLLFDHGSVRAEVISVNGAEKRVRFEGELDAQLLAQIGRVPLPPYIQRDLQPEDTQWYQTVYACNSGAVAAPTAGLHFTEELLNELQGKGVEICFVTLHVGWGTFKPVGEKELQSGRLHSEWFQISSETLKKIGQVRINGGRVIAVGTTVVRVLETVAHSVIARSGATKQSRFENEIATSAFGRLAMTESIQDTTDLFIRPPFEFQMVDAMVTNFHLPGTSLLWLVAAFVGEEQILSAYQEAIRERYRFYSYGDAMFIQ